MKCIYCGSEGPFDSEHILPRCLGTFEGERHLEDTVCQCCNNRLGNTVDLHFCRSGPEALFRSFLQIRGRKDHSRFSPYESGPAGPPAAEILLPYPGEDFPALWVLEPGTHNLHPMRQIVLKDKSGAWHPIPVRDRLRTDAALRAVVSAVMDGDPVQVHLLWEKGKDDWLPELVHKTFGFKTISAEKAEMESFSANAQIKLTVKPEYFRAIAKIAFNFLLQQTTIRGDEPEFAPIRDFIMNGGDIDRFVRQTSDVMIHIPPGMWFDRYGHVLSVARINRRVRAWVAFMVGPEFPGNKYHVELGGYPSPLILPRPQLCGNYYHYYETRSPGGLAGGIDVLTSSRIILPIGRPPLP